MQSWVKSLFHSGPEIGFFIRLGSSNHPVPQPEVDVKILVGYDGSTASRHALRDLGTAGLPRDVKAHVVTVAAPGSMSANGIQDPLLSGYDTSLPADEAARNAAALAAKAARILAKRFPEWKIASEATVGRPAAAILDKADAWKPDLIVLGSHGRSMAGRLVLGSVCQRIIHHARTDVRVTKPGKTVRRGGQRILVGIDGSPGADRAVAAVASRSWPPGTSVRVVMVVNWRDLPESLLILEIGPIYEGSKESAQAWISRKGESAARLLVQSGLRASHHILVGDPRRVLSKACKTWKADCLFVGSRGLHAVDRFLIGSTSSHLAAHAPCTVEIVRK